MSIAFLLRELRYLNGLQSYYWREGRVHQMIATRLKIVALEITIEGEEIRQIMRIMTGGKP